MTIVVTTAFLRSTRGTAGTDQWHNTCSSEQWYDATSAGLCLNASKVVSVLDCNNKNGAIVLYGNKSFKVYIYINDNESNANVLYNIAYMGVLLIACSPASYIVKHYYIRCQCLESIVNDFGNRQGVVSGRAAAILRSTEAHP